MWLIQCPKPLEEEDAHLQNPKKKKKKKPKILLGLHKILVLSATVPSHVTASLYSNFSASVY